MKIARFLSILVLAAAGIAPAAGSQAAPPLPQTQAGHNVEAYLKAFNAGEAAMREFFSTRTAAAALEKTPVEARLDRYRQMRERLGTLELRQVVESRESLVTALVHGSLGPLVEMTFEFEAREPFGLVSLRVMDVGGQEGPPAEPKRDDAELASAVKAYVQGLAAKDEFSGVVLVTHGGKTLVEAALGLADRERKAPNRTDTKFNIGSINKSFTETAVRMLAAEGKLSLDDTIGKFLPDYPNREAAASVTVRQLLDMTSGIGDFFGEAYEKADKAKIRALADYLPLFADRPLEFAPGTRKRYSNGGFVVLGLIVAKASGMDYYAFIRERIYKPAGMASSDSFAQDEAVPNRALGYTKKGASWASNFDTLPGRGSSAGGGYSTAADLLRYVSALRDGKLGPAEAGGMHGGMGIAGGAPGLNAAVEWDPGTAFAVIVLSNFDPPSAESVARRIRSWLPRN